MIKKEWFWMSNHKRQNEEHCHYSGLPSPMAYETKKTNMKNKNDLKTSILIAMLSMAVLISMVLILL